MVLGRGIGPLGRGGARRRTRRRMIALSSAQKSQIEKQAGKSVDNMTDEELEAEMKKRGIEVPKDEAGEG